MSLIDPIRRFLPKALRSKEIIIPAVRLHGPIMAGSANKLSSPTLSIAACAGALEKAFEMKDAPAVAIIINSPGGSPVQSNLIYKRIRALAEEHSKHVLVAVEDVAASGGYLIALAGDEIIADASSIVGSIGVISAGFGFTELIEKIGVQRRVYTSGKNKMILDPFQPEKQSDIDYVKALQEELHETFIDLVKSRRGDVLNGEEKDIFSGQFWTGQTGQSLGLVDRISDITTIVKERYGEKAKLKVISQERGLFRKVSQGVQAPINGHAIGAGLADELASQAEIRAIWARYGL